MVCEKCSKKQNKLATPDVWKEEAPKKTGARKVGANMLLEKRSVAQFDPYGSKCGTCKKPVTKDSVFCQHCAYKKGVCQMCGVKILDTKYYKQSVVWLRSENKSKI